MNVTDPIADLLTRIRNANQGRLDQVTMPHSRVKENVARVLQSEGYLNGVEVLGDAPRKQLVIAMKYTPDRRTVFTTGHRVSTPGRRVYIGYQDLGPVRQGLGIAILSTPKGIMTDAAARKNKVGGEVLCKVW